MAKLALGEMISGSDGRCFYILMEMGVQGVQFIMDRNHGFVPFFGLLPDPRVPTPMLCKRKNEAVLILLDMKTERQFEPLVAGCFNCLREDSGDVMPGKKVVCMQCPHCRPMIELLQHEVGLT